MSARLTFFGAAQNVTGSCYLLEVNGSRLLIDCGQYQERDLLERNWNPFPFAPGEMDAVLLTHAHLDHCGLIPRLVNQGFRGRVYCSSATADIADIVLLDAGKIQEEDLAFKRRRHDEEGRRSPHPYEPLFTRENAEAVRPLYAHVPFGRAVEVSAGIRAEYFISGHILGAASIRLTLDVHGALRQLLFSGDVGRWNMPIIRDPTLIEEADFVVVESTYGDRLHEKQANVEDQFADIINETHRSGGNVVIPSFAVERAQDVVYCLHKLVESHRIRDTLTFVDSPMAIQVNDVFQRHPDLLDDEAQLLRHKGVRIADYPGLKLTRSVAESKAINRIRGGVIIIAGSGMCTGGRIKHHLANNISRPESTVLFVGFQAEGTLGRSIVDGAAEVRIHGRSHPVRARIARLGGFSGHADQAELLRWMSGFRRAPRQVYVTHGEPRAATTLAGLLKEQLHLEAVVPAYRDGFDLT